MSIYDVISEIKKLGLKAKYDTEWEEFAVSRDGKNWYYTNDRNDALNHARSLIA